MTLTRRIWDGLTSMKTAIVLLILLCLYASIGSFIPQDLPLPLYYQHFSPIIVQWLNDAGIFHLYDSIGFLGCLGFLLFSTLLCIFRRSKQQWAMQIPYVQGKHGSYAYELSITPRHVRVRYQRSNIALYAYRTATAEDYLYTAPPHIRQYMAYLMIHLGIILLFFIAFLDSNGPYRFMLSQQNHPTSTQTFEPNISFKANVAILPHQPTNTGDVIITNEHYRQALPFSIELLTFHGTLYPDGTPAHYESTLLLDHHNQRSLSVNHPLSYKNCILYQTGFEERVNHIRIHLWQRNRLLSIPMTVSPNNDYPILNTLLEIGVLQEHIHRSTKQRDQNNLVGLFMGETNISKLNHLIDLGVALTYHFDDEPNIDYQAFLSPYHAQDADWALWSYTRHDGQHGYIMLPYDHQHALHSTLAIIHWLSTETLWPLLIQHLLSLTKPHMTNATLWETAALQTLRALKHGDVSDLLRHTHTYPPHIHMILIQLISELIRSAWSITHHQPPEHMPITTLRHLLYAVTEGHALLTTHLLFIENYEKNIVSYIQVRHLYAHDTIVLVSLLLIFGIILMMICRQPRHDYISCHHNVILYTYQPITNTHPLFLDIERTD